MIQRKERRVAQLLINRDQVYVLQDLLFVERCQLVQEDEELVGLVEAGEKWNGHPASRSNRRGNERTWVEAFLMGCDLEREEKVVLAEAGEEVEVGESNFQKNHLKDQVYQLQRTGMKNLVIPRSRVRP